MTATAPAGLSPEQGRELLRLARATLRDYLDSGSVPEQEPEDAALRQVRAAFVTLTRDGQLRGCMGCLEAALPLHRQVQRSAVMAASQDPRFRRLTAEELPAVEIEISVLGPLERVTDVEEIEIGVHGLLIESRGCRGTLLPQVPVEAGWDREQFLAHLCAKAGLPGSQWRRADLFRYTAQVFSE